MRFTGQTHLPRPEEFTTQVRVDSHDMLANDRPPKVHGCLPIQLRDSDLNERLTVWPAQ